jgi:putative ABC transport system substrate-binding protein
VKATLHAIISLFLALLSALAWADQTSIARIGVIMPTVSSSPLEEGLREGLRDLGYIDGKNVVIEWRRSAGTSEELRSLAANLAGKVDIIVAIGSPAARAALQATTLPVVFTSGDPVQAGFASSLAKPGGNGTGVSVVSTQLNQKGLELLHELAAHGRRIVYLMNPSNPLAAHDREAVELAARALGIQLAIVNARDVAELNAALRAIHQTSAHGLLVSGDLFLLAQRAKIAQTVRMAGLPALFMYKEYHDAGVLMSYGPNFKQAMRLVAGYVDKILRGAKPSDLPIEQISKYELVINLRVAREMGLRVPQELLLRADEVIR